MNRLSRTRQMSIERMLTSAPDEGMPTPDPLIEFSKSASVS